MSRPMAALKFILFICGTLGLGSCLAALVVGQAESAWAPLQDSSPEHAFVLEVPKGWIAKAGTFRLGYSDVRLMIDLKSPDGKANVRIGDVSIPAYAIPNQFHSREG